MTTIHKTFEIDWSRILCDLELLLKRRHQELEERQLYNMFDKKSWFCHLQVISLLTLSSTGHLIDNINKTNWIAVRYPFKHDPCYKKVVKLLEGLWQADMENTTVSLKV